MELASKKHKLALLCLILVIAVGLGLSLMPGCESTDDDSSSSSEGGKSDLSASTVTHISSIPTAAPSGNCNEYSGGQRFVNFAGYCWQVRDSLGQYQAAGNCIYSSDPREVWTDSKGNLHLKLSYRDGNWRCAAVLTTLKNHFGYGTYEFYVEGNVHAFDDNVVLGLFTWDDNLYQVGHLNEIDIELTKWGHSLWQNLHYSVQPTHGPDTENGSNGERDTGVFFLLFAPESTHVFTWQPTRIDFASYHGYGNPTPAVLGTWTFDDSNPARRWDTGTLSTPVVIPKPSPTTSARISLWLTDANGDGRGDAPTDGQEVEVTIVGFQFKKL